MVQIPFASFIWPTIKHRIGQHFIYVVKYYILACYINPCGDSTGMFTTMQRRLCVGVCVCMCVAILLKRVYKRTKSFGK